MPDAPKRPSLREAARRGAEANRQAKAAQQQPTAAVEPAASRTEQVAARCGHPVSFTLHPDGKDKFREQRRRHIADRDCPECRRKAHEARTAAEILAARQRRAGKAKQEAQVRERLPHGSRFDVAYDAQAERWTGTLTVPNAGGEPAVFTGSASGVFQLLRSLDEMFRGQMAPPPTPGGPP